jgi:roadblock/LC7 domain-containing protein
MMKKFFAVVVLVLGFVGLVMAGNWTDVGKYQEYKSAKAMANEADDAGNTSVAVSKYLEAADLSKEYATLWIQVNQMNSAAYSLIKVFKQTKESGLLVEAKGYLEDAKAQILATIPDGDVTKLDNNLGEVYGWITSNLDFCNTWLSVK